MLIPKVARIEINRSRSMIRRMTVPYSPQPSSPVMNIINIVQGELVILGGYIAWLAVGAGVPPLVCVPLAAAALGLLGWGLYGTVIRRIIERDLFISILARYSHQGSQARPERY